MVYEIVVDVERKVAERYLVTVRADTAEEAKDIAWEYTSDFPNSDMVVERFLKQREVTLDTTVMTAEEQEEARVSEEVFYDDGA